MSETTEEEKVFVCFVFFKSLADGASFYDGVQQQINRKCNTMEEVVGRQTY